MGHDVPSYGHDSASRQKTPSPHVVKVSERPQRRLSPEQLSEQGKHARPPWHWSDAVQVPHNPTTVVRHWSAGTAVQAAKCWSTPPEAPKSRSTSPPTVYVADTVASARCACRRP